MAGGWCIFVILVCPVMPGPFFPERAFAKNIDFQELCLTLNPSLQAAFDAVTLAHN